MQTVSVRLFIRAEIRTKAETPTLKKVWSDFVTRMKAVWPKSVG